MAFSQVLLASGAGDDSVADWVYQRSPAELKEALLAARKKREQSEVSWPETLAISACPDPCSALRTPVCAKGCTICYFKQAADNRARMKFSISG